MGLHCEFQSLKLALGPPWDSSLTKCCLQAGGQSTPVVVTRQATVIPTPSTPRGYSTGTGYGHGHSTLGTYLKLVQAPVIKLAFCPTLDLITAISLFLGYSPQPQPRPINPTRNMPSDFCAAFPGQLCSHNCVTEGASYRCTCDPGFKLLEDFKSCGPDPNSNAAKYTGAPTMPPIRMWASDHLELECQTDTDT